MFPKKSALAQALLGALAFVTASAQEAGKTLSPVIVTADPLRGGEDAMILTPAKVLSGDELRNKAGQSLGDTLGGELGVQASGFSAATSRCAAPEARTSTACHPSAIAPAPPRAIAPMSGWFNCSACASTPAARQHPWCTITE